MALGILETCFLPIPRSSSFKPHNKHKYGPLHRVKPISFESRSPDEDDSSRKDAGNHNQLQLAKLAVVAMAAGVLALGSVDPAVAAKTGGRVGGQAFRSTAPPPRSAAPRINNSRTNVYINPPIAPPLVGGYGYGLGSPFYGGWGWSPFSFFAPGPGVVVGVGGGGLDLFVLFVALSVVSAVFRRFFRSREDDDDDV